MKKDLWKDILYTKEEFLKSIEGKDNYENIAENVVKIYLILKNKYIGKFRNMVEILVTAGMIDMLVCLESNEVDIYKIIDLAIKAVTKYPDKEKNCLSFFIELIEILIFDIYSYFPKKEIEGIVQSQKYRVDRIIEEFFNKPIDYPSMENIVEYFMSNKAAEQWRTEVQKTYSSIFASKKENIEIDPLFVNCPACKKSNLQKTDQRTLICPNCNSKFLKQNEKYKYTFIKDTDNPFWDKYHHDEYTPNEWNELSEQFTTEIEEWEDKNEIESDKIIAINTMEAHPWRRYFARAFDMYTMAIALLFALVVLFYSSAFFYTIINADKLVLSIIIVFIYVVLVEPVMLSAFGTTPGKALLKISVADYSGNKISYETAMKRNLQLWIKGLGIGIPIITFFTLLISYNKLNNLGTTDWDDKYKIRILYGEVGFFRYLLFAVIFFVISMFYSSIFGA